MLMGGGFFGVVEGQRIFGGKGQQPGSSGADGATILGSKGSRTLCLSSASSGRVEGGESPLLPSSPHIIRDRQGRDGPARAPVWLGSGLSLVTLGDKTSQLLSKATRCKVKKTFSLLPLGIQVVRDWGPGVICCGVVGEGSQFCLKLARGCAIRDHWARKKVYDVMVMEDGFYINDVGVG